MNTVYVRRSLERALASITPSIATAWENVKYRPSTGTPYQQVNCLFARPENPTVGGGFHRENGIFQIRLMYPSYVGSRGATERAGLIRAAFSRGTSFRTEMVDTIIQRTPEIYPGRIENGRYVLQIDIRFFADIFAPQVLHEVVPTDAATYTDTVLASLFDTSGVGVAPIGSFTFGGEPVISYDVTSDVASYTDTVLASLFDTSGVGVAPIGSFTFGGEPVISYDVTSDVLVLADPVVAVLLSGGSVGVSTFGSVLLGGP